METTREVYEKTMYYLHLLEDRTHYENIELAEIVNKMQEIKLFPHDS